MKIKTFNIYILFILFSLTFSSCEEDNDVKLIETNHQVIYTSEMDFENTIQVNGKISFSDVSQGVVSREWRFPENVVDIIDSENDLTSNEVTVKTIFNQAGTYDVYLHQEFKGDAYVGETIKGKSLDTTIVVTVLDSLKALITANYINEDGSTGAELNLANMAENVVTASKSIRFSQSTIGGPENFDWTLEGGDPETVTGEENSIDVKYKKLGVYDVKFIASRERPEGIDTIYFKDLIKVIPSTDPVDLEQVTEKDGKIALVFSREMDAFSLDKNNFNVTIENDGNIITSSISKVSIDPDEGNIVLIELNNNRVYNDDIVTVSYTPGILMTTDAVEATAFTDVRLEFETYNILQDTEFDYSFENTTATEWPYLWWGGEWGMYDLDIVSSNAQDGSKSAYIEYHENGGMIIGHNNLAGTPVTVPIKAGQAYEFGLWIYVTEDFASSPYPLNDSVFESDIRIYPSDWSFEALVTTFTEDFPIGEWVYTNTFITGPSDSNVDLYIRGYNVGTNKRLKFYMDNFSISEVNLRP
ncbi:hypothetical protein EGM88_07590 [Aureibaculum marinum]|uniref:PKD domain-containing protein n=1 Tax=Aureibaculum marinum TaxID=2487930 RepID=A0A3N4NZF9_9FLAO|nr:hypothetical protein [Aureibaculum marinum]RPD97650.1 hypothetical protein EGM88_07590 [Aureibaculum marinum]